MADGGAAEYLDLAATKIRVPKYTPSEQLINNCRDGADSAACTSLIAATKNKLVDAAEVAKKDAEIEELQTKIRTQAVAATAAPATLGSGKLGAVPKTPVGSRAGKASVRRRQVTAKPNKNSSGGAGASPAVGVESGGQTISMDDSPPPQSTPSSADIATWDELQDKNPVDSASTTDDEGGKEIIFFQMHRDAGNVTLKFVVTLVNDPIPLELVEGYENVIVIEDENKDGKVHEKFIHVLDETKSQSLQDFQIMIEYANEMDEFFLNLLALRVKELPKSYNIRVYVDDSSVYNNLVKVYHTYLPVNYVYKQRSLECGPAAVVNALTACEYFKNGKSDSADSRIAKAMGLTDDNADKLPDIFSKVCAKMELESSGLTPTLASGIVPDQTAGVSLMVRAYEFGGELAVIYGHHGDISYKDRLSQSTSNQRCIPFVQLALGLLDEDTVCGLIVPDGNHYTAVVRFKSQVMSYTPYMYVVLDSLTDLTRNSAPFEPSQTLIDPSDGTIRYATFDQAVSYIHGKVIRPVRSVGTGRSKMPTLGVLFRANTGALRFIETLKTVAYNSTGGYIHSYYFPTDYAKNDAAIMANTAVVTFGATSADAIEFAAATYSTQVQTDLGFVSGCDMYPYDNVTFVKMSCFNGTGDSRHAIYTYELVGPQANVKTRLDNLYEFVRTSDKNHYPMLPPAGDQKVGMVNKILYCTQMSQIGEPTPENFYQLAGIKKVLIYVDNEQVFSLVNQLATARWTESLPDGLEHVYVLYSDNISDYVYEKLVGSSDEDEDISASGRRVEESQPGAAAINVDIPGDAGGAPPPVQPANEPIISSDPSDAAFALGTPGADEGLAVDDDSMDSDDDDDDGTASIAGDEDTIPGVCNRVSHLKEIATLRDISGRGRGWVASMDITMDSPPQVLAPDSSTNSNDESPSIVLAPYEGTSGEVQSVDGTMIPFKKYYENENAFDAFLATIPSALSKQFEAYSMMTASDGVLSAFHPDANKIPEAALINHNGVMPNVKFASVINGCVDVVLIKDIASGEEIVADYGGKYDFVGNNIPLSEIGLVFEAAMVRDVSKLAEWVTWLFALSVSMDTNESLNHVGPAFTDDGMKVQATALRDVFPSGPELSDADVIVAYQMQPTFLVSYYKGDTKRIGCGAHTGWDRGELTSRDPVIYDWFFREGANQRTPDSSDPELQQIGFDFYNLLSNDARGTRTHTVTLKESPIRRGVGVFTLPTFTETINALNRCPWPLSRDTGPDDIPWDYYDMSVFLHSPFTSGTFDDINADADKMIKDAENAFGELCDERVIQSIRDIDYASFISILKYEISKTLSADATPTSKKTHEIAMALAQVHVDTYSTRLDWRTDLEDADDFRDDEYPYVSYHYNLIAMYQAGYPPHVQPQSVTYRELARLMRKCPTVADVHAYIWRQANPTPTADPVESDLAGHNIIDLAEQVEMTARECALQFMESLEGLPKTLYTYFIQADVDVFNYYPLRASGNDTIDSEYFDDDADEDESKLGLYKYFQKLFGETSDSILDFSSNISGAKALADDAVDALMGDYFNFDAKLQQQFEILRIEPGTSRVVLPADQSIKTTRGTFGVVNAAQTIYRNLFGNCNSMKDVLNDYEQPAGRIVIPLRHKSAATYKAELMTTADAELLNLPRLDFMAFMKMICSFSFEKLLFPNAMNTSATILDAITSLNKDIEMQLQRISEFKVEYKDNPNVIHVERILPLLLESSLKYYQVQMVVLDPVMHNKDGALLHKVERYDLAANVNPWINSRSGRLNGALDELSMLAFLMSVCFGDTTGQKVTGFVTWEQDARVAPRLPVEGASPQRSYERVLEAISNYFHRAFGMYGITYVAQKTVTALLANVFYGESVPGNPDPFLLAFDVALRAGGCNQNLNLTVDTQGTDKDPRIQTAVMGGFTASAKQICVPLASEDAWEALPMSGDLIPDQRACTRFLKTIHPGIKWNDAHGTYALLALYTRLVYSCFIYYRMDETIDTKTAIEVVRTYCRFTSSEDNTLLNSAVERLLPLLERAMVQIRSVCNLDAYIVSNADEMYAETCLKAFSSSDWVARRLLMHHGPAIIRRIFFSLVDTQKHIYTSPNKLSKTASQASIMNLLAALFRRPEFKPKNMTAYVMRMCSQKALENLEFIKNLNNAILTLLERNTSLTTAIRTSSDVSAILVTPSLVDGFTDLCSVQSSDYVDADLFEKVKSKVCTGESTNPSTKRSDVGKKGGSKKRAAPTPVKTRAKSANRTAGNPVLTTNPQKNAEKELSDAYKTYNSCADKTKRDNFKKSVLEGKFYAALEAYGIPFQDYCSKDELPLLLQKVKNALCESEPTDTTSARVTKARKQPIDNDLSSALNRETQELEEQRRRELEERRKAKTHTFNLNGTEISFTTDGLNGWINTFNRNSGEPWYDFFLVNNFSDNSFADGSGSQFEELLQETFSLKITTNGATRSYPLWEINDEFTLVHLDGGLTVIDMQDITKLEFVRKSSPG